MNTTLSRIGFLTLLTATAIGIQACPPEGGDRTFTNGDANPGAPGSPEGVVDSPTFDEFTKFFPLQPGNNWLFHKPPRAAGGDHIIVMYLVGDDISLIDEVTGHDVLVFQWTVTPAGPVLTNRDLQENIEFRRVDGYHYLLRVDQMYVFRDSVRDHLLEDALLDEPGAFVHGDPLNIRFLTGGAMHARFSKPSAGGTIRSRWYLLESIFNFGPKHGLETFGCISGYDPGADIDVGTIASLAEDGLVVALFENSACGQPGLDVPRLNRIYAKGFGPVQLGRSRIVAARVGDVDYNFLP